MASLCISTPFNIDLEYSLAPIHKRFFAWMLDCIVMVVYFYIMSMVAAFSNALSNIEETGSLFVVFIFYTPILFYHLLFELLCKGQSLGKMAMGIRVISADGNNASFSQLLIRWLMRSIDNGIIFISYISILIKNVMFFEIILLGASVYSFIKLIGSSKNQKLGDLAANTVMVLKTMPYRFDETIFKIVDTNTYVVTYPQVMKLSDKDLNIINNILTQNRKSNMIDYMARVTEKIKTHLQIESDLPNDYFLEKLLEDYNYLTQKNA